MKYKFDPPLVIKKAFPGYRWNTSNRKVLLTFDDGPIPETTETILKELNGYKLKAAFFCVGNNVNQYSSLANSIIKEGHLIGNHTYNHTKLTSLKYASQKEEIMKFNSLLGESFNYLVRYFRPPHGRFTSSLGRELREKNMTNVMWSLLTFDYKNKLNIVKFALENYLKCNSIVVLHDSLKSKDIIVDSIKIVVDQVYAKGYEFGDPAECLR